jgi:hypothetical protein
LRRDLLFRKSEIENEIGRWEKKLGDPKKIRERRLKMKMVDGKKNLRDPKKNSRAAIENENGRWKKKI